MRGVLFSAILVNREKPECKQIRHDLCLVLKTLRRNITKPKAQSTFLVEVLFGNRIGQSVLYGHQLHHFFRTRSEVFKTSWLVLLIDVGSFNISSQDS